MAENHVRRAEIVPRLRAAAGPKLGHGRRTGEAHDRSFVPSGRTRSPPGNACHVCDALACIHGAQRGEGSLLRHCGGIGDIELDLALIDCRERNARRSAARESKIEAQRLWIEHNFFEGDERAFLNFHGADQEGRAIGSPAQIAERPRPSAPVTVARVEAQHWGGLPAIIHPQLDEVEAAFDALAYADGYVLLSPKTWICPSDKPEIRPRPEPRLTLGSGDRRVPPHIA